MTEVQLIDTTIRDGQQSLWAMNMRTRHALPVLEPLDRAGFDQIELMAPGAAFKKLVRHLGENPWHWVHQAVERVRETPLRWHGTFEGPSMSGPIPPEIGELMMRRLVDLGIRYTRTGDNWNRFAEVLADKKTRLERIGITPVLHLMYSVSPRHTDDYFVDKAKEAAALRPFRLCLKDVGGLLTPERARTLLPKVMEVTDGIPWEFHGHCSNGLGPLNALEAARAGIPYIHTAAPPLSNGNSLPSVVTTVENLREYGYECPVDLTGLEQVTEHLRRVARQEGFKEGVPHEYEERQYRHQVPGGMISNLEYQLRQVGLEARLDETLDETERVRADYGYPIMVTPLSQIVATQAAVNVIVGERYGQVTDSSIEYALGQHGGREATDAMDPDVRERFLDRPRARELANAQEKPSPTLAQLRERLGDPCDEDLILRAIVGEDAVEKVGRSHDAPPQAMSEKPLVRLVEELATREQAGTVAISKGDLTVTVRKDHVSRPQENGQT